MKKSTNNIIVEAWLKRELLASIAIYYEKQNISFRNLPELIRRVLTDFEHMIASSGGDRVVDPLEASNVLQRLRLRGHKEDKSGPAYLKSLQFSQHHGEPMFTREDALREMEKAAEAGVENIFDFDEQKAIEKSQRKDQELKDALAQGPNGSTIIKEE